MADVLISVDPNKCEGESVCVGLAPEVFRLNAVGKSEVINPDGADREPIIAAAMGCPTLAIIVLDAKTGKHLAP
jgi:ferredoxin